MITKQDDLLGSLIHDVAHLLRLDIDRRLKAHNLTRVKWLALGIIARQPHLTQRELAEKMELGNAAVGRLVDRLVERGFVKREADPDDRRAYRLLLSQRAETLLKELKQTAPSLREDLLAGLHQDEIAALNKGLTHLKRNLKTKSFAACFPVFTWLDQASLTAAQNLPAIL